MLVNRYEDFKRRRKEIEPMGNKCACKEGQLLQGLTAAAQEAGDC
jgi:hypothetical protein